MSRTLEAAGMLEGACVPHPRGCCLVVMGGCVCGLGVLATPPPTLPILLMSPWFVWEAWEAWGVVVMGVEW